MPLIALRGATVVAVDEPPVVAAATQELLRELLARNALETTQVVSAFFTCTDDLASAYPAQAARDMGWTRVPMLCAADQRVRNAMPRCLRVLLHVHAPDGAVARHVYLHEAAALRDDLDDAV